MKMVIDKWYGNLKCLTDEKEDGRNRENILNMLLTDNGIQ